MTDLLCKYFEIHVDVDANVVLLGLVFDVVVVSGSCGVDNADSNDSVVEAYILGWYCGWFIPLSHSGPQSTTRMLWSVKSQSSCVKS